MARMGKQQKAAIAKVEEGRRYAPSEALALAKEAKFAKFDETVELHIRLGVDPRHADQQVRGVVALPHGTDRQARRRRPRSNSAGNSADAPSGRPSRC